METMPPLRQDSAKCEELVRRAWEAVRHRWKQVDLPEDVFIRHVLRLLPTVCQEYTLKSLLEKYDLEGLYLACACVNGVPNAANALEQDYMAHLPAPLRSLRLSEAMLDEVCQKVRMHLLVGTPRGGPRLATYTGSGGLMSWMQVIATRMALKLGASVRETPDDNALAAMEDLPAPGTDPEMALLKSRYRRQFSQAVREAFAALPNERYLLQLHFIERLPTTKMAPLFDKDQSTISRWLKDAREAIYWETKRRLKDRLQLTTQEFESLMETIRSRFDVSLSQILNDQDGDEGEDEED
jgi:RNA polymerase sigma-70 factor